MVSNYSKTVVVRDDDWLENLLSTIWSQHFIDIERKSNVVIKFGRRARSRLGSISYNSQSRQTIIRLSGLFRDPNIPELVIKATIVHELCHYAHGFHSGLRPKFDYPHAGGVVRREFAERDLEDLYIAQKRWLRQHWRNYIKITFPPSQRRFRSRKSLILPY